MIFIPPMISGGVIAATSNQRKNTGTSTGSGSRSKGSSMPTYGVMGRASYRDTSDSSSYRSRSYTTRR